MLRHHEQKPPPLPVSDPDEIPDRMEVEEDLPSSTSLKGALARANANGNPYGSLEDAEGMAGDPGAKSSLPLALARANESRKLQSGQPEAEVEAVSVKERSEISLSDFFFRFDRFADEIHPMKGWGVFSVVFFISAVLIGHELAMGCLPVHPGVRTLTGAEFFWVAHAGRALGLGLALSILGGLGIWGLYRNAGGRPPYLWVFKVFVYALVPMVLLRIYMLLSLIGTGMEPYFRGWRPESWGLTGKLAGSILMIWAGVRLVQGGGSRHCQAVRKRLVLPVVMVAALGVLGIWSQEAVAERLGRGRIRGWLEEAERGFLGGGDVRDAMARLGADTGRWWSYELKRRFYRLRSEVKLLEENVLVAREDAVRLVRMVPETDNNYAYGRGVNLLAMGQTAEAVRLMEGVTARTGNRFTPAGRWLYRVRAGKWGEEYADESAAEQMAKELYYLEPNAVHLEMAAEMLHRMGKSRPLVREVREAEASGIALTARTALLGALAAEQMEDWGRASAWLESARGGAAEVAESEEASALAERLAERLTSRP